MVVCCSFLRVQIVMFQDRWCFYKPAGLILRSVQSALECTLNSQMSSQFTEICFTHNAFSYQLDPLKRYWEQMIIIYLEESVCVCAHARACVCVGWSVLMIAFCNPGFDCVLGLSKLKHQSNVFCSFFDCKKKLPPSFWSKSQSSPFFTTTADKIIGLMCRKGWNSTRNHLFCLSGTKNHDNPSTQCNCAVLCRFSQL